MSSPSNSGAERDSRFPLQGSPGPRPSSPGSQRPPAAAAPEGVPTPPDTQRLLEEYSRTRSLGLRNELVTRHEWLVARVVQGFGGSSCDGAGSREDLFQVGCLGLIRAVERFEPERGVSFAAFAVPTVAGVIKHYLRDKTWGVKAPRRMRELGLRARKLGEELEQRLGRPPTLAEVAAAAGVDEDLLLQAMDVLSCYRPASLDVGLESPGGEGSVSLAEELGRPDPALAAVEHRELVRGVLKRLDERQRTIIHARYFEQKTQAEVAQHLGISQMHVSRLERQALRVMQACVADTR